jgi:hypothetical protein
MAVRTSEWPMTFITIARFPVAPYLRVSPRGSSDRDLSVKGAPLAALLDPAAPPQRAGVIASMNMVADSLESLPEYDDAQGKTFRLPSGTPGASGGCF